jgi:hypothetical protein
LAVQCTVPATTEASGTLEERVSDATTCGGVGVGTGGTTGVGGGVGVCGAGAGAGAGDAGAGVGAGAAGAGDGCAEGVVGEVGFGGARDGGVAVCAARPDDLPPGRDRLRAAASFARIGTSTGTEETAVGLSGRSGTIGNGRRRTIDGCPLGSVLVIELPSLPGSAAPRLRTPGPTPSARSQSASVATRAAHVARSLRPMMRLRTAVSTRAPRGRATPCSLYRPICLRA